MKKELVLSKRLILAMRFVVGQAKQPVRRVLEGIWMLRILSLGVAS